MPNGHADDDPRARQELAVVGLLDEVAQHASVISKSAITPSLSGRIATIEPGRPPEHLLGLGADRQHPPRAARVLLHRDHRRLVAHDPFTLDVDEGIRRAEIDREVVGKPAEY